MKYYTLSYIEYETNQERALNNANNLIKVRFASLCTTYRANEFSPTDAQFISCTLLGNSQ